MPYYLSRIIGDGSDAEGNQFRPAIADHTGIWTCLADGRADATQAPGRMIVRADHLPVFDTDPRIQQLTRTLLADPVIGAPDDGEADQDDLAFKVVRRFLVRQLLRADDLPNLSLTLGDIPAAKRQRIKAKLEARNVDFSGINNSTTIANALRAILPQLKVRIFPSTGARPSGTFTDDFSGEGSDTDLALHTPSGGTAWTRVGGTAGDFVATSGGVAKCGTATGTAALYQCDDQGNVAHYVQFDSAIETGRAAFPGSNRATDGSNFIGIRHDIGPDDMNCFKRNAGSFTQLGSNSVSNIAFGDTLRLESDGDDAHEAFLNSSSAIGPVTDAFNNAETRQGIVARSGIGDVADNFEAGLLAGTIAHYPFPHRMVA